jgi:hypothetical protein
MGEIQLVRNKDASLLSAISRVDIRISIVELFDAVVRRSLVVAEDDLIIVVND